VSGFVAAANEIYPIINAAATVLGIPAACRPCGYQRHLSD